MAKALHHRSPLVRVILGLLALAFTASLLTALGSASARAESPADLAARVQTATTPSAAPSGSASAESIGIWVRKLSDKSNVAGVKITITGPGGFSQVVTTDAKGLQTIGLPAAGTYKVLVDVSSIPAGDGKPLGLNPRQVQVDTDNQGVPAYFLLSTTAGGGSGGGTTPTPGSTGSSTSGSSSSSGGTSFADVVFPRVATGLIFGLLIALASIGVSLIYGTTGLNNFAHGELVTFGSLTGYVMAGILHVPGPIAIVSAFVLGGVFGWVQDLGLWKPLRRRGVALIPLMIVSIGLSLALRYIFQFIFGPDLLVTPSDSSSFLTLGPVHLRSTDVSSPIICIVVLLAVAYVLLRTRIGKATRAVADNRSLAAASGINVERVIRIVWIGGGALAGLSGALIGYYQPVSWQTGASILLLIFASVTLGGLGTAFGALVGSVVIGLLVDLSTIFIPSNMKLVAALLVMIVILLFRPQGILGRRDRIG
ncbi:branched-chain amino acid ABC transporter permease [Galbitalea soli]|uniref:Branched-chain amino acid ABC transporter permease n=1 Tax=Galbitalea soli TaxID=1268042 RepID=A0A7C9PMX5_9MICO|nr:branched-chain amino acid ABC transporter permease [Galbitalea soli]NEM91270.1 branched-chain amino acid ABC transporter permease [Galbitalea soli]NYJ29959.1 branched-chain amino acid transport system permease protein [Galbitalea soli]